MSDGMRIHGRAGKQCICAKRGGGRYRFLDLGGRRRVENRTLKAVPESATAYFQVKGLREGEIRTAPHHTAPHRVILKDPHRGGPHGTILKTHRMCRLLYRTWKSAPHRTAPYYPAHRKKTHSCYALFRITAQFRFFFFVHLRDEQNPRFFLHLIDSLACYLRLLRRQNLRPVRSSPRGVFAYLHLLRINPRSRTLRIHSLCASPAYPR